MTKDIILRSRTNFSNNKKGHNDCEKMLIDACDAALLCGISRSTWYKAVASGKTPHSVKIGRSTRWLRDDLICWIQEGCPSHAKWVVLNRERSNKYS